MSKRDLDTTKTRARAAFRCGFLPSDAGSWPQQTPPSLLLESGDHEDDGMGRGEVVLLIGCAQMQ